MAHKSLMESKWSNNNKLTLLLPQNEDRLALKLVPLLALPVCFPEPDCVSITGKWLPESIEDKISPMER
ncbi:rho GTPase-activating protein [Trifolium repens]|nr:rho GTPase-activating protein [Trifolium repens]